jgi:hypothetical protein
MFRSTIIGVVVGISAAVGSVARAVPVPSVVSPGGQVLNVQAVVGSGADSSFEVVDFQDVGGPAFAWEYEYPAPTVENPAPNGWEMLEAIAAADPNLSFTATYYPSFLEHFVDNFTYGSYTGNSTDFWNYWNGAYDSVDQSADWTYAGSGPDLVTLSNGSFDGWVANGNEPNLPEISLPEPGALGDLLILGSICLLFIRRPRAAGVRSR